MPKRYYTPNRRISYEDYTDENNHKNEKNKLMLEKFERLYDQLIKTHIRKKN